MPDQSAITGQVNRWYKFLFDNYESIRLPNGPCIKIASPSVFLATKLEAFSHRGNDYLTGHDIEDVVTVIDGRADIVSKHVAAPAPVQKFVSNALYAHLSHTDFLTAVSGYFPGDAASQQRVPAALARLRKIAAVARD